ncbi:hypothetical protein Fcan01_24565, partial [Folsomia candida]
MIIKAGQSPGMWEEAVGSPSYAQIPEEDRDPSDPKARIGKLVGSPNQFEEEDDDAKHENEQQQQQEQQEEQQEKIHDASSQSTSSHTTKPDEEEVFMDADDEGETTILVETPEGNYEYDPDKKKIEIPSRKL